MGKYHVWWSVQKNFKHHLCYIRKDCLDLHLSCKCTSHTSCQTEAIAKIFSANHTSFKCSVALPSTFFLPLSVRSSLRPYPSARHIGIWQSCSKAHGVLICISLAWCACSHKGAHLFCQIRSFFFCLFGFCLSSGIPPPSFKPWCPNERGGERERPAWAHWVSSPNTVGQ